MKKRVLSLLLAFVLLVGLLPTVALATEVGDPTTQVHVIVENTTFTEATEASGNEPPAWSGLLVEKWVDLTDTSTMMSCIVDALGEEYPVIGAESNYIREIFGLAEFHGGPQSGWMGTLNDWFVHEGFQNFGVSAEDEDKKLLPGDEICVMYTSSGHGEDLGGSMDGADKTVKGLTFSTGAISPSFNAATHEYTLTVTPGTSSVLVAPTASNKNFQVRTSVGETEYRRTVEVPIANGTVITVKCGDPSWPSMNSALGAAVPAEVYTITVVEGDPSTVKNPEVPAFTTDLSTAMVAYAKGAAATALTVAASVPEGTLSYQWQSSTDGTVWDNIADATAASYTPSAATVGTSRYRCVVTNTLDSKTAVGYSSVAKITVTDSGTCGDALTWELKDGVLTVSGTGAMTNFKKKGGPWQSYSDQIKSIVLESGVTSVGNNSFRNCGVLSNISFPSTLNYIGSTAFINAVLLENLTIPDGDEAVSLGAGAFRGCTNLSVVNLPNISSMGSDCFAACNSLTEFVLQGSINELKGNTLGSAKSVVLPAGLTKVAWSAFSDDLEIIYFCGSEESWKKIEFSYPASEPKSYQIIFNYSSTEIPHPWNGEGTKEKPYELGTAQDVTNLASLVRKGYGYGDIYFKVTANIELPENWSPIGGLKGGKKWDWSRWDAGNGTYKWYNLDEFNVFHGNIDGLKSDGSGECWTITVPKGRETLLGALSGNTISNLNIYGEKIEGYGVFAYYVMGTTDVTFDHVTLKSGSHTKYSGFLGGYVSGVNAVTLRNCVVEEGVVVGDDGTYPEWAEDLNTDFYYRFGPGNGMVKLNDMVGSFGGAFNGYMENCVSYAKVYGRNYVGGILGFKGQSMGDCILNGCSFGGEVHASGKFAGGIVGSGYSSPSAPNSPAVSIQNCAVSGNVTGATCIGGIFGGEETLSGCWNNGIGYIRANYFTGSVTATDEDGIVGGIIGYMDGLNCYNVVSRNYYLAGTAEKGIGKIDSVYYAPGKPHGRDDDPTGADAEKLTAPIGASELTDGKLVEKLNSALTGNTWKQGDNAPVLGSEKRMIRITNSMENIEIGRSLNNSDEPKFKQSLGVQNLEGYLMTVTYSDGSTENVPALEMELRGIDFDQAGCCQAGLYYKGYLMNFGVEIVTDLADAAKPVVDLIDELPDFVTLANREAVEAAREAYEQLTDEQKACVTNYDKLLRAEKALERQQTAIVVGVLGGAAEPAAQFPFGDVSSSAWYYSDVKNAWENGLINGMNGYEFQPEGTLTVAQAIKLAAALHEMYFDSRVTLENGAANWFDTYVAYAVENRIIEAKYAGYSLAQMNAPISRAEFVHIFHGAMNSYYACNAVADNAIPDVKSGDAYADEIYTFYRAGILTGSDGRGTFKPASSIRRCEVAAILIRMYDTNARQAITLG